MDLYWTALGLPDNQADGSLFASLVRGVELGKIIWHGEPFSTVAWLSACMRHNISLFVPEQNRAGVREGRAGTSLHGSEMI